MKKLDWEPFKNLKAIIELKQIDVELAVIQLLEVKRKALGIPEERALSIQDELNTIKNKIPNGPLYFYILLEEIHKSDYFSIDEKKLIVTALSSSVLLFELNSIEITPISEN